MVPVLESEELTILVLAVDLKEKCGSFNAARILSFGQVILNRACSSLIVFHRTGTNSIARSDSQG